VSVARHVESKSSHRLILAAHRAELPGLPRLSCVHDVTLNDPGTGRPSVVVVEGAALLLGQRLVWAAKVCQARGVRELCEAASTRGQLAGGEVAAALAELGMLTTCASGLTVSEDADTSRDAVRALRKRTRQRQRGLLGLPAPGRRCLGRRVTAGPTGRWAAGPRHFGTGLAMARARAPLPR
jgi:hypothetical protein